VSTRATELTDARAGEAISVHAFDGSVQEWDSFVEKVERSTFCHLGGWREIVTDVLGHQCLYAVASNDTGVWEGVLPMVRVKSPLFGHYLVSMPFLNYGGPIGSPVAEAALTQHALAQARRLDVDLLELRSRTHLSAAPPATIRKITVLLDLPPEPEVLWHERFRAKLRSQIRRPQKDGMVTQFGLEQVEPFYEVFSRNMRDLGTPVLPRGFFERLSALFPDAVVFGVVYRRDEPVAAGCGFVWQDEFEMTWASALRKYSAQAPNMLLYWAFMENMVARGIRVFNFGRCTSGSGTHRFKRQWGGMDVPLPWIQWTPRNVGTTPSPERPLFHLAATAWSHVPLALANRVGPLLAKNLP